MSQFLSLLSNSLSVVGGLFVALATVALAAEYAAGARNRCLGKINLKGRVVIVTGAGTGIGKAIAEVAHARGAHVVICGRRRAPLEAVAASLGNTNTTVVAECDVTKEDDIQRLFAASKSTQKEIALVVLNAGRSCCGEFDELNATMAAAREMIELNYMANVRLSQIFLPALQQSRGAFLAISSLSGLFPTYRGFAYSGAKHALNGFLDTLRLEQLKNGVSATISCPSYAISDVHASQLTNTGAPPPVRDRTGFMTAEFVAEKSVEAAINRAPKIVLPKIANIPYVIRSVFPRLVEKIITKGVLKSYGDDGSKTLLELAKRH